MANNKFTCGFVLTSNGLAIRKVTLSSNKKPSSSVCALSEGSYGILVQYAHTENRLADKHIKPFSITQTK